MKCIRKSVFETNSSSEHSLSIVKKSNFDLWKSGKQYARRVAGCSEFKETWGNFWSEQYYWAFDVITKEEVEKRNREIFDENLKNEVERAKIYISQASGEQSKKWAQDHLKDLENSSYEKCSLLDKLYDHMWITYDEYIEALRHDDCYSPFEHINETEDVVVFGKYFHS